MANPQPDRIAVTHDIDYQLAFDLAPIGLVLSRNRTMVNCNRRVCEMFGATREQLIGQTNTNAPARASRRCSTATAPIPTTGS